MIFGQVTTFLKLILILILIFDFFVNMGPVVQEVGAGVLGQGQTKELDLHYVSLMSG